MMGTGFDLLCLRRWHGIDATSYACEATLSVGSPLREQSEHLFRLPIFSRRIHHNLLKLRVGGHSTPNHLFQQTIHSVQSSSFSPPSLISRHRANMAESVVHSPFLEVGISSNSFSAPKTMPSSESLPIRFSQRPTSMAHGLVSDLWKTSIASARLPPPPFEALFRHDVVGVAVRAVSRSHVLKKLISLLDPFMLQEERAAIGQHSSRTGRRGETGTRPWLLCPALSAKVARTTPSYTGHRSRSFSKIYKTSSGSTKPAIRLLHERDSPCQNGALASRRQPGPEPQLGLA